MNGHKKDARILIVDDTTVNIQVLGAILKKESYQINVAQNGLQALEAVETMPPDLILMDVMMPKMGGFEACERLKASEKTKDIPVIFLTAKVEPEDVVKGFQMGAVDYITKPFNAVELLVRVKTHLTLTQQATELKATLDTLDESRMNLAHITEKLAKYLPTQIYQSIFMGEKDAIIETQRKTLTIFFSDIVDFTSKSEGMGQQKLTNWLNTYLNDMADAASRYEATLDKFIGDAIMIFFGDPQSFGKKMDAIKCVIMALEMQFRAKLLGMDIRIGINTGECAVGNFGSENRMNYTIVGREVNLAARLEQNGEAGKILISEATHELVKDVIHCEPHSKITPKGMDREIMTYLAVKYRG